MAGLGKGKEERRTHTLESGRHVSEGLYWGYRTLSVPTTTLYLCGNIESKELAMQSHNSQPGCPMPSISPGNRAAQTCITAPCGLRRGQDWPGAPVKGQ